MAWGGISNEAGRPLAAFGLLPAYLGKGARGCEWAIKRGLQVTWKAPGARRGSFPGPHSTAACDSLDLSFALHRTGLNHGAAAVLDLPCRRRSRPSRLPGHKGCLSTVDHSISTLCSCRRPASQSLPYSPQFLFRKDASVPEQPVAERGLRSQSVRAN